AGRDGGGNVATSEAGGSTGASVERGQGGGPAVARTPPPEDAAPTVPGCEDTDKVARQLCEAATKEEDPFLRAALWDEYNEYKKIIARQWRSASVSGRSSGGSSPCDNCGSCR